MRNPPAQHSQDQTAPKPGRWGLQMYARILAQITWHSRTYAEVAAELNAGAQSMREVLWSMVHLGLAHVAAWEPPAGVRSSYMVARIRAGEGANAPYPVPCRKPPGSSARPRRELAHFAGIVRELRDGATRQQVHEATGVFHHHLTKLLRQMRDMGLARVADYEPRDNTGGRAAEVWQLGMGPDKRRPPRQSAAVRGLRYRNRKRARKATADVARAIAGLATLQRVGVKSFHLLGAR